MEPTPPFAVRSLAATAAASGTAPPSATPAPTPDEPPTLRIHVRGFRPIEHRLLEGTVSAWRQRTPRLAVVDETQLASADVVMIDCTDPAAAAWVRQQPWLAQKPVVWVDARSAPPGHVNAPRPITWPVLPILLVRAIETHAAARAAAAAQTAQPAQAAASAAAPAGIVTRSGAGLASATLGARSPAPSALAQPARQGRRILVVDDSPTVRQHLLSLLEGHGHTVTLMEEAGPAIDLLATRHFDAVLLDVLMPGIDGYEACRRIKAQARSARRAHVVMLTSKTSPFDRIRGKMAGCDAYLTKPVETAQLMALLQSLPTPAAAPAPPEWVASARPA